jgi:Tfp pilus assembly protein PilV
MDRFLTTRTKRKQRGQSMLELVVALGVLVSGVIGMITLGIASLKAEQISSRKIVAYNLAREGLEVVRHVRDSNWLHGYTDDCTNTTPTNLWWFYGYRGILSACDSATNDVVPAFDATTYQWSLDEMTSTRRQVWFDTSTGLYYQSAGPSGADKQQTIYSRWLTLTPHGPPGACPPTGTCTQITYFDVVSTVEFNESGRTQTVTLGTRLDNWRP